jgi:hypothetical protein
MRCNNTVYSITSSAIESTPAGIVRPSAFAVLRLMTSSNLVGVCTGRSAGLSPLNDAPSVDARLIIGLGKTAAVAD